MSPRNHPVYLNKNEGSVRRFRACISSYIILSCCLGFPLIFIPIEFIMGSPINNGSWQIATVSAGMVALNILLISRYQIILSHDFIAYKSPFGRKTIIHYTQIEKATFSVGYDSFSSRGHPQLIIKPLKSIGLKVIHIKIKFFAWSDVKCVFEAIEDKIGKDKCDF